MGNWIAVTVRRRRWSCLRCMAAASPMECSVASLLVSGFIFPRCVRRLVLIKGPSINRFDEVGEPNNSNSSPLVARSHPCSCLYSSLHFRVCFSRDRARGKLRRRRRFSMGSSHRRIERQKLRGWVGGLEFHRIRIALQLSDLSESCQDHE